MDWCYVTRVQLKQGYFHRPASPSSTANPPPSYPPRRARWSSGDRKVVMVHMPGTVTFTLKGDEKRVRLEFGFLPGAYTGEGRTDGGDVIVELVKPGQPPRELFRRTLQPLTVPGDRGRLPPRWRCRCLGRRPAALRTAPLAGHGNAWAGPISREEHRLTFMSAPSPVPSVAPVRGGLRTAGWLIAGCCSPHIFIYR